MPIRSRSRVNSAPKLDGGPRRTSQHLKPLDSILSGKGTPIVGGVCTEHQQERQRERGQLEYGQVVVIRHIRPARCTSMPLGLLGFVQYADNIHIHHRAGRVSMVPKDIHS